MDSSGILVGSAGTTSTAGNDTFSANVGATGANATDTLNATDVINGGAGTDTLNLVVTAANTAALNGALISGIEVLNIRAGAATVIDASTAVGANSVIADRGVDTLLINNLATGASVTVNGNGTVVQGEVAFAPATAASAITLNFTNGVKQVAANDAVTAAATIGKGDSTGTATTATITSTGAANVTGVVDLANATLTTVTINAETNLSGDFLSEGTDQVGAAGTVTISGAATSVVFNAALDNTITTLNAAGLAGGLTATLGTGVLKFTGGAGKDIITTAATTTALAVIDGGAGTADILNLAATNDVSTTAKGAQYTNFETLRVNNSQDVSLIAGITAIEVGSALTSKTISGLSAVQAANIIIAADTVAAVTFALKTATGTADVLSLKLGTGLTTAAAVNLATSLVVNGFETLNLATNAGPTATAGQVSTIGAITGTTLKNINLTGAGFSIAAAETSLATTIDGSALTGVLTLGGDLIKGSTVSGGSAADLLTLGANRGSTYNGNAGKDVITSTVAALVATGTDDTKINGGADTDTLVISDAVATLTDNHFTNVTNMEALTLSTGIQSLTTGAAFNAAFSTGVTLTDGVTATTEDLAYNLGLANMAVKVVSTGGAQTGATTENVVITTGSGADDITWGATGWLGVAATGGTVVIATGAGDDKISVTTGTLAAQTTGIPVSITGGTGADTITTVHVNGGTTGNIVFVVADGDSLAASRDKITGFNIGTAALFSDTLNLEGTPTIQADTAGVNGTDSGNLRSHAIAGGLITFSATDVLGGLTVINQANLADALAYVATNISTATATVMFAYDSDSSGTVDATIVFNQGTLDSVIELVGAVGVTLNATNGATLGLIDLA